MSLRKITDVVNKFKLSVNRFDGVIRYNMETLQPKSNDIFWKQSATNSEKKYELQMRSANFHLDHRQRPTCNITGCQIRSNLLQTIHHNNSTERNCRSNNHANEVTSFRNTKGNIMTLLPFVKTNSNNSSSIDLRNKIAKKNINLQNGLYPPLYYCKRKFNTKQKLSKLKVVLFSTKKNNCKKVFYPPVGKKNIINNHLYNSLDKYLKKKPIEVELENKGSRLNPVVWPSIYRYKGPIFRNTYKTPNFVTASKNYEKQSEKFNNHYQLTAPNILNMKNYRMKKTNDNIKNVIEAKKKKMDINYGPSIESKVKNSDALAELAKPVKIQKVWSPIYRCKRNDDQITENNIKDNKEILTIFQEINRGLTTATNGNKTETEVTARGLPRDTTIFINKNSFNENITSAQTKINTEPISLLTRNDTQKNIKQKEIQTDNNNRNLINTCMIRKENKLDTNSKNNGTNKAVLNENQITNNMTNINKNEEMKHTEKSPNTAGTLHSAGNVSVTNPTRNRNVPIYNKQSKRHFSLQTPRLFPKTKNLKNNSKQSPIVTNNHINITKKIYKCFQVFMQIIFNVKNKAKAKDDILFKFKTNEWPSTYGTASSNSINTKTNQHSNDKIKTDNLNSDFCAIDNEINSENKLEENKNEENLNSNNSVLDDKLLNTKIKQFKPYLFDYVLLNSNKKQKIEDCRHFKKETERPNRIHPKELKKRYSLKPYDCKQLYSCKYKTSLKRLESNYEINKAKRLASKVGGVNTDCCLCKIANKQAFINSRLKLLNKYGYFLKKQHNNNSNNNTILNELDIHCNDISVSVKKQIDDFLKNGHNNLTILTDKKNRFETNSSNELPFIISNMKASNNESTLSLAIACNPCNKYSSAGSQHTFKTKKHSLSKIGRESDHCSTDQTANEILPKKMKLPIFNHKTREHETENVLKKVKKECGGVKNKRNFSKRELLNEPISNNNTNSMKNTLTPTLTDQVQPGMDPNLFFNWKYDKKFINDFNADTITKKIVPRNTNFSMMTDKTENIEKCLEIRKQEPKSLTNLTKNDKEFENSLFPLENNISNENQTKSKQKLNNLVLTNENDNIEELSKYCPQEKLLDDVKSDDVRRHQNYLYSKFAGAVSNEKDVSNKLVVSKNVNRNQISQQLTNSENDGEINKIKPNKKINEMGKNPFFGVENDNLKYTLRRDIKEKLIRNRYPLIFPRPKKKIKTNPNKLKVHPDFAKLIRNIINETPAQKTADNVFVKSSKGLNNKLNEYNSLSDINAEDTTELADIEDEAIFTIAECKQKENKNDEANKGMSENDLEQVAEIDVTYANAISNKAEINNSDLIRETKNDALKTSLNLPKVTLNCEKTWYTERTFKKSKIK